MSSEAAAACGACVCCVGVLCLVILLPISIQKLEYYQYGLLKSAGGSVDTDKVYGSGRTLGGPAKSFVTYPANAIQQHFDQLEVFSAGADSSVGLSFKVDIDYTYLLIEEEVGELHNELAKSYQDVISARTRDAIKNEAIYFTFNEYFQNRTKIERRFREAVILRWDEKPSVHAMLDQFYLGRIRITDSVAGRQLDAAIQNERNEMEANQQQAELEREQTASEVNTITLEADNVLRTAEAEADLIRSNAVSEASQITAEAEIDGLVSLFNEAQIQTEEEKTAYTYVRNLYTQRNTVDLDVSYLSTENVVKTAT